MLQNETNVESALRKRKATNIGAVWMSG